LSFALAAAATIFRDVGLVCLILFFLWRNSEPVSRVGWTWRHPVGELILGAVCFVPVFLLRKSGCAPRFLTAPCCVLGCPHPRRRFRLS
jgi:hypothetical protein